MLRIFLRFIFTQTILISWLGLLGQTGDGISIIHHNVGPYVKVNSPQTVWLDIENFSSNVLNEVDVYCQLNNSAPMVQNLTGLDLGNWVKYLFKLDSSIVFEQPGPSVVKLWLDNVNGEPQSTIDTLVIPVTALNLWADRTLLLETFTSTDCISCVAAGIHIRELENTYGSQLFSIGYQTNCYSGNPMCLLAQEHIQGRMNYYDIQYTPLSIVTPWYKGNALSIDPRHLEAELERPSPMTIEGEFRVENDLIHVDFKIVPYATIDLNMMELVIAFTEDEVNFNTAPGSNDETTFYQVLRRIKYFSGDDVKELAYGDPVNINFTEDFSDILSDVNLNQFRIGIFFQHKETQGILQTAELTKQSTGINSLTTNTITLYPNPSVGLFYLQFTPTVTSDYRIIISNYLGQTIKTETIKANAFEENTIKLSLHQVNSGIYFVTLLGADFSYTSKLIVK